MSKPSPIPFKPLDFDAAAAAARHVTQTHRVPVLTFPADGAREREPTLAPEPAIVPKAMPLPIAPAIPASPVTPTQRIPVSLPDYVVTDIKQRALKAKTTNRFIIMQALKDAGIHIHDEDMVEDGRRNR